MLPAAEDVPGYRRWLRLQLPAEAFRPDARRLGWMALHLAVVAGGAGVIGATSFSPAWWVVSLISGHSMACLGFLAHELSHNAVIRMWWLRQPLELLIWGLLLVPATVWRHVHNEVHHHEANTLRDPDRRHTAAEMGPVDRWYCRWFYPHAGNSVFNPLVAAEFIPYIARVTLAMLFGGGRRMPPVPAALICTRRRRARIVAELIVIVFIQTAAWRALDGSLLKLFHATLLPVCAGSGVAMMYLFTNHFLRPLAAEDNPLVASTSVIVPRWVDVLHSRFSYHTEHHIFPTLRSAWLPRVSELLQKHYPEAYQRLPLVTAWRVLLKQTEYQPEEIRQ